MIIHSFTHIYLSESFNLHKKSIEKIPSEKSHWNPRLSLPVLLVISLLVRLTYRECSVSWSISNNYIHDNPGKFGFMIHNDHINNNPSNPSNPSSNPASAPPPCSAARCVSAAVHGEGSPWPRKIWRIWRAFDGHGGSPDPQPFKRLKGGPPNQRKTLGKTWENGTFIYEYRMEEMHHNYLPIYMNYWIIIDETQWNSQSFTCVSELPIITICCWRILSIHSRNVWISVQFQLL